MPTIGCTLCPVSNGPDLDVLPKDEEELMDHIESAHHISITRDGESCFQSEQRFVRQHPEILTCSCNICTRRRLQR